MIPPRNLRVAAVRAAHSTHLGVSKTKSVLRQEFWWPAMDRLVNQIVAACEACRMAKPNNRNFRTSWSPTQGAWERVHVDFAGPIQGTYLLVLVDSHTNYPEVHLARDMTSGTVIHCLRRTFAQFGVPHTLVSDNGPAFVSEEIRAWLARIGCKQLTSPAYHPQSNGQAERVVRTIKEAIKANGMSQATIDRYLLFFRSASCGSKASPGERLFGRRMRAPLLAQGDWQPEDKYIYQAGMVKEPATLIQPLGSNTAQVVLGDGRIRKVHRDQLRRVGATAEDKPEGICDPEAPSSGTTSRPQDVEVLPQESVLARTEERAERPAAESRVDSTVTGESAHEHQGQGGPELSAPADNAEVPGTGVGLRRSERNHGKRVCYKESRR